MSPKMHCVAGPGEMPGEALSADIAFIKHQDCSRNVAFIDMKQHKSPKIPIFAATLRLLQVWHCNS